MTTSAPQADLLTHMLTAEVDGEKLSEGEVISTAILLLNAGHEATVHTTGNGLKAILESGLDPKILFGSDKQTEATVEECLRFDAPLHMFTRYALSDLELEGGIALRKGDVIGLMLGAANRDPSRFAEAATFDPFRSDGANVSFGAGIHFCIGAPLARIEMHLVATRDVAFTIEGRRFGINLGLIPSIKNVDGAVLLQFKLRIN